LGNRWKKRKSEKAKKALVNAAVLCKVYEMNVLLLE